MLGIGDGRPDNSPGDLSALVKAYAQARAQKQARQAPQPVAPSPPISGPQTPTPPAPPAPPAAPPAPPTADPASMLGPHMFNPVQPPNNPAVPSWAQLGPLPSPAGGNASSPSAAVPLPAPRPQPAPAVQAAVPQPGMSFWQRNTAMMRDPATGAFLDPQAAAQADASGPDLIQKFMNHFNQKGLA